MLAEALAVLAPFTIMSPQGGAVASFEMGAAEGPQYPSLVLNNGDIRGPRNMQGGSPGHPDFDIGAGSTQEPGNVNINYDIGRSTTVWDGSKSILWRFTPSGTDVFIRGKRIARFRADRVDYYVPVYFHTKKERK